MLRRTTSGDTLIEVMLAFTIFTMVAVGTFVVMNRGIGITQQSLELTLVREQIDAQAEMLRYVRDTQPTTWQAIKDDAVANGGDACYTAPRPSGGAFFLRRTNLPPNNPTQIQRQVIADTNFRNPTTYSLVNLATGWSYGIWIYAVQAEGSSSTNPVKAYDMHIHACWDPIGGGPKSSIATIVRLYD